MKTIKILVSLFIAVNFASCVTLGEKAFFFPDKYNDLPADAYANIETIPVELTAADNTVLKGIEVKYKGAADYLIYFYGNMKSVKESRDRLYFLSEKFRINVICFDYRSYGLSSGEISFDNIGPDAVLIFDVIKQKAGKNSVFVFSQSLGTAAATFIGASRQPDGIMMEAPFTNAQEAVPGMTEGLIWPLRDIIKLRASEELLAKPNTPLENIRKTASPLLIIHGRQDDCFPLRIGQKMYDEAGSKEKYFCLLENTKHTDVNITSGPAYQAIDDFIRKYRKL